MEGRRGWRWWRWRWRRRCTAATHIKFKRKQSRISVHDGRLHRCLQSASSGEPSLCDSVDRSKTNRRCVYGVVVLRPLRTAAWTQSSEEVYRYPVVRRHPRPSFTTNLDQAASKALDPPSPENLPKMSCTSITVFQTQPSAAAAAFSRVVFASWGTIHWLKLLSKLQLNRLIISSHVTLSCRSPASIISLSRIPCVPRLENPRLLLHTLPRSFRCRLTCA